MGIKDQDEWGNIGWSRSGGKEQVRTRRGPDKAEITWSDCKKSSKSKVAVGIIAREEEVVARSRESTIATIESRRLGDTVRSQRGQVGVPKSQEIAKIVVRCRGRGMMTQSVDRGDRRRVTGLIPGDSRRVTKPEPAVE